MNSVSAASFRFPSFSPREARQCLLKMGAQESCCSLEWIENHWRWIVWKFASLIRAFPEQYSAENLSPSFVLAQLAYRYEREVNACQRSCLKRCLERDDSISRYCCLMIAQIDLLSGCLELSDGWYSCWTTALDPPLRQLLQKNQLFVGQKLELSGAQLTGSDDGIPALEGSKPDCPIRLLISRNCIRRAKWDTKLGFNYSHPSGFLKHLRQIHPQGGHIPGLKLTVLRVYPLCFRDDVSGTLRSEREHFAFLEQKNAAAVRNVNGLKEEEDSNGPQFSLVQKIKCGGGGGGECLITWWRPLDPLPQEGNEIIVTCLKTPIKPRRPSWMSGTEANLLPLNATKVSFLQIISNTRSQSPSADISEVKDRGDYDISGNFLGKHASFLWFTQNDALFCVKLPPLLMNISFPVGDAVQWRDLMFVCLDSKADVYMFEMTERTDFKRLKSTAVVDIQLGIARFKSLVG